MKTLNIILTLVFAISILTVAAQGNSAQRPVSKDVQKFANKSLLSEELLTVASLGYPTWAVSKDVQVLSSERPAAGENMVSEGYPYWTISKGIYRKVISVKAQPLKLKPQEELISSL